MTAVIARTAVVPVYANPSLRAEQTTQFVLGETARVLEAEAEWRKVRSDLEQYVGWVHAGYCAEMEDAAVDAWRRSANAWSRGAVALVGTTRVPLPLRARVAQDGDAVCLPGGTRARLLEGDVVPAAQAIAAARSVSPECWAAECFAGAPYQWGGVTPWGVDCSGLVQTTFLARGTMLPRDSADQAACGTAAAFDAIRPGDLLFFRGETTERITHVAFAGEGDALVHSTVSLGGMVCESWAPGSRAAYLRERLVAVRRLESR
ncbi:MAG: C40 family peptidase [Gemmatimonadales bacterium]